MRYAVQVCYDVQFHAEIAVEAESPEDACQKALEDPAALVFDGDLSAGGENYVDLLALISEEHDDPQDAFDDIDKLLPIPEGYENPVALYDARRRKLLQQRDALAEALRGCRKLLERMARGEAIDDFDDVADLAAANASYALAQIDEAR